MRAILPSPDYWAALVGAGIAVSTRFVRADVGLGVGGKGNEDRIQFFLVVGKAYMFTKR